MPDMGVLYLAPPIAETQEAMNNQFLRSGFKAEEPYPGVLAVTYSSGELRHICEDIFLQMSNLEQEDTRVLLTETDEPPSVSQLVRMRPLSQIVAMIQGEWLIDILSQKRLEIHFQPIVDCANPERVHAFECLLRGQDGSGGTIPPNQLFDTARASDLLFHLDREARLACIDSAHQINLNSKIFINFNPTAIYNPEFCLKTTMAAIEKANMPQDQIVFEVVESDQIDDIGHLVNILNYYRRHGFKVALDDMGSGFSSLNLLSRIRPDYMKMDMELIRGVDKDDYKAHITENLLNLAQKLNIRCIAEGVETEGEWRWLAAHGADLVQGYLFARPAAEPPAPVVPIEPSV